MAYETLLISQDARGVVDLCLNAPGMRNALSAKMIEELTDFARATQQNGTRVVTLRGSGKVFCAGGDLHWMRQQMDASREERMREARKLADMLRALNEMPVPLIGLVHGGAFGGGIGLACVCDAVIADRGTKFGLTETRLGLIPATISPYVLARIGEGMARRIFMSSRVFDANEAYTLGFVAKVVDGSEISDAVAAEVSHYLHAGPNAIAQAKQLARRLGSKIDDAVIDESIALLADIWESDEAKEGIDAFFNQIKPSWS